ncbi:MAG: hypothetical protein R3F37_06095 [Candidatus Competibacteraceae bacterium]
MRQTHLAVQQTKATLQSLTRQAGLVNDQRNAIANGVELPQAHDAEQEAGFRRQIDNSHMQDLQKAQQQLQRNLQDFMQPNQQSPNQVMQIAPSIVDFYGRDDAPNRWDNFNKAPSSDNGNVVGNSTVSTDNNSVDDPGPNKQYNSPTAKALASGNEQLQSLLGQLSLLPHGNSQQLQALKGSLGDVARALEGMAESYDYSGGVADIQLERMEEHLQDAQAAVDDLNDQFELKGQLQGALQNVAMDISDLKNFGAIHQNLGIANIQMRQKQPNVQEHQNGVFNSPQQKAVDDASDNDSMLSDDDFDMRQSLTDISRHLRTIKNAPTRSSNRPSLN